MACIANLFVPMEIWVKIFSSLTTTDVINFCYTSPQYEHFLNKRDIVRNFDISENYHLTDIDLYGFIRERVSFGFIKKLNINKLYWVSLDDLRKLIKSLPNLEELLALNTNLSMRRKDVILYGKLKSLAVSIEGSHFLSYVDPGIYKNNLYLLKRLCINITSKHPKSFPGISKLFSELFAVQELWIIDSDSSHTHPIRFDSLIVHLKFLKKLVIKSKVNIAFLDYRAFYLAKYYESRRFTFIEMRYGEMNPNSSNLTQFDVEGDVRSVGLRWEKWKRAFSIYIEAAGIEQPSKKRANLLHLGGLGLQEIFYNIPGANVPEENDLDDDLDVYSVTISKLDEYFSPKHSRVYERHVFRLMKQEESEGFGKFLLRLRTQAEKCGFRDIEENLIDQIVENERFPTDQIIPFKDVSIFEAHSPLENAWHVFRHYRSEMPYDPAVHRDVYLTKQIVNAKFRSLNFYHNKCFCTKDYIRATIDFLLSPNSRDLEKLSIKTCIMQSENALKGLYFVSLNRKYRLEEVIKNCPKVKHLEIRECCSCNVTFYDAFYFLCRWQYLEDLTLEFGANAQGKFLLDLTKDCKNLKRLRIIANYNNELLNRGVYHAIAFAQALEDFRFESTNLNFSLLFARLCMIRSGKLRRLYINCDELKCHRINKIEDFLKMNPQLLFFYIVVKEKRSYIYALQKLLIQYQGHHPAKRFYAKRDHQMLQSKFPIQEVHMEFVEFITDVSIVDIYDFK